MSTSEEWASVNRRAVEETSRIRQAAELLLRHGVVLQINPAYGFTMEQAEREPIGDLKHAIRNAVHLRDDMHKALATNPAREGADASFTEADPAALELPKRQVQLGDIVLYSVDAKMTDWMSQLRTQKVKLNMPAVGDLLPMIVTAVWEPGCISGNVFADGHYTRWVTSVYEGTEPNTWRLRS